MASKNISFSTIPASIRKPGKYFELNNRGAVRTLPGNLQQVLIIGQRTSAGTVAQKVATRVFSDADASTFFGVGSMCHLMARAAITAYPYLQLTVIALDDANAGGVQATGTVTIGGPATGAGVLSLIIGNREIDVAIANLDTANNIASALNTAIGLVKDLPVTATVLNGVVTLLARNKGLCGNDILLAASVTAAGVTATIVAMATGATDPAIQDALTVAFGGQYDIIVTPYNNQTALGTLKTHVETVSNAIEERPSIGVYAMNGALGTATTLSGQINEPRILGALLRYTAATIFRSQPCEIAAAYGAVMASEEDPARPLNTLPLTGIAPPAINDVLIRSEQESCLNNGVAPLEVGPGQVVQIVRAISTYTLDASSVPDISYLDITTVRTLDYVRKACRDRISNVFPREKLSSKTPPKVRSELLDVLLKLEDLEIVENVADNKDGLVVERDLQDPNRLDAKIPADVVNGLHVFAGRIDLIL